MTQTAPKPITPPPRHNFIELPRIRSERPAFELHTRTWYSSTGTKRT